MSWSPSNKYVFIATHDAVLTVYNVIKNTEVTIGLIHSPISQIVPISDSSFIAVAYDRNIYQYECDSNDLWAIKRSLTKESNPVSSSITTQSEGTSMSVQDRVKQFGALQKKQSLIVTSSIQFNIHRANVNSAVFDGKNLLTSDYAGFVKSWNL